MFWVDSFLRYFVEVTTCTLDGSPAGPPAPQVHASVLGTNDIAEVLKDEKQLGQLIQRFVVVAEFSSVAMLRQDMVAQPVNRRDPRF